MGGDQADKIHGGLGNDTIYGSAGNDILMGAEGADTFDFSHLGFSSFVIAATQELKGGPNSSAAPDMLILPGAPTDYVIAVNLGTGWATARTTLTYVGGTPSVTIATDQIEKVQFSGVLTNEIALGNVGLEMARQMIEAYGESTSAAVSRNWHPISAIELGMLPSDYGTLSRYAMIDGLYGQFSAATASDAVATVVAGVVDGLQTLSISFRGTNIDQGDVYELILADLMLQRDSYFQRFAPLVDAVVDYLNSDGDGIDQILITGHSLGGAMAQHFADYLALAGFGDKVQAFTFGSIGGEPHTVGLVGDSLMNFLHVGDVANALNSPIYGGDTRGGSHVFINYAGSGSPLYYHGKELY